MASAVRRAISRIQQFDLFSLLDAASPNLPPAPPAPVVVLHPAVAAILDSVDRGPRPYYLDGDRVLPETWPERARANLDAIRLADTILAAGRHATPSEQARLALFSGFGASDLANGCFRNPGKNDFRRGWGEIGRDLEAAVSPADYAALARGTQYAHYTPESLVRAIWAGLQRLGARGGAVLEPGIGTGLFASLVPPDLRGAVRFTGIEADPVTARIAALLHPDAIIRTEEFERSRFAQKYNLAVGNPPYSARVIRSDPAYRALAPRLHDYFIAKSLDLLVPGGLAAFVTSQGTMDKDDVRVRAHIATNCDLLGAIRLPEGTFRETAGTEVGVDILFLRRIHEDEPRGAPTWIESRHAGIPGSGLRVNAYWLDHPEMVLGTHAAATGPYGLDYACLPVPERDLDVALAEAIARLPAGIVPDSAAAVVAAEVEQEATAPVNDDAPVAIVSGGNLRLREGSYFVSDDDVLMQVIDGAPVRVAIKAGQGTVGIFGRYAKIIRALIPVRDAVRAVLGHQERQECSREAQADLGRAYDAFVAVYGFLNHTVITPRVDDATGARSETHRQPNLVPFRDDPDCWLVASIEDYDLENLTGHKGLIFTGTVIAREAEPVIASASDALARCLHEQGRVDVHRIAVLAGKTEDAVLAELGPSLYRNPETQEYEAADEYLSGKVRDKLAAALAAAAADPDYRRNVDALEAVQPTDIPPSDITARLGAPWIPAETIGQFVSEIMRVRAPVRHVAAVASWSVDEWRFGSAREANQRFGTHRYPAVKCLLDALNARIPAIYDEVINENGNLAKVINSPETEAAKEKLSALKGAFESWVWHDAARADMLARIYNDTFNNIVARRFDGSHLTLPGAAATFKFYPHQKNAIWRMICGGTYVAHAVGAGKSATMAAAIIEQRRLGLINKAILTVPGHCLGQFAREFLALYPMARILVADETNFAKDKRRRFLARAATGDWDAIIITHSAFKFIPLPVAFERAMMEELLAEYEALISDVDSDDRLTRKKLEGKKERYRAKLEALEARKDDFLTISEIGIDQIYADEAQDFRKLSFSTNMSIKGVDPDGSQMAWDLFAKAKFIREARIARAGGDLRTVDRALNLASGTPITNTLGEMFTVQRFMDMPALVERGLHEFDAWASAFGETRTDLELQPSGRYKPVTRFAEFVNVPELIAMFRSFADVVSGEDLKLLVKRPRIEAGKRQIITAPPSPAFKAYQQELAERIQKIEDRKGQPKPGDDILLSVITDGRHAAIDMRLVGIAGNEPENKINKLIDNVHAIYAAHADRVYLQPHGAPWDRPGASQMIFSDLGTLNAEKRRGFSAYGWIRDQLVARGIPADEIAIVQNYSGTTAKNRLFADMRAGKVRVTIGSTKKMGTGVNAQNRLVALHHLDVPWLPSDIEQREGRIDRQGNQNEAIGLFAYATEGSMDATMWQANERKARFIASALAGDRSVRRLEDIGEGSVNQFAMAKAIASGDPRLMQKAGLESEIARLERLRSAHLDEQHTWRSRVRSAHRQIESCNDGLAYLTADIERRGPMDAEFAMTVGKLAYVDRKEAGKALTTAMANLDTSLMRAVKGQKIEGKVIATIRGFDIAYSTRMFNDGEISCRAAIHTSGTPLALRCHASTPGATAIDQIEEELAEFEARAEALRRQVRHYETEIAETTPAIGRPFPLDGELRLKLDELTRIEIDLAKPEEAKAPVPRAA